MTISPSGSWIWQNRHYRSIRNGPNSREPVWLCWKYVRNGLNRSKNNYVRRTVRWGWTGNILRNILSAWRGLLRHESRLGSGSAWRLGSARIWRSCGSVVFNLCRAWVRLGYSYRNFRRRVGITSGSDKADFCTSEFVWMSSTLWNDQKLFLTTLKIQVSPKKLVFCDERGSDTNCWWEKPLVVALKHSEGIKHIILFQQQEA